MRKFIVTVDTEGDALWNKGAKDSVATDNAKYIPEFQTLCEKYAIVPTYLVNYEMALDDGFVKYIKPKVECGLCEIGMHLHAWNMPGYQDLNERTDKKPGKPFLIEYPEEEMDKKISNLVQIIENRFEVIPTSHRAGRWAMNDVYAKLLCKHGFIVDCSVTPHISWLDNPGFTEGSHGPDYTNCGEKPYILTSLNPEKVIWEIPMTIRKIRYLYKPNHFALTEIKHCLRSVFTEQTTWMRILGPDIQGQLSIINRNTEDYIMFMLHSSELMPGSRYFATAEATELFFRNMEILFQKAVHRGFVGQGLTNYVNELRRKNGENKR